MAKDRSLAELCWSRTIKVLSTVVNKMAQNLLLLIVSGWTHTVR